MRQEKIKNTMKNLFGYLKDKNGRSKKKPKKFKVRTF